MIDVPGATGGRVLRILMNGDLDEAVGLLGAPTVAGEAHVEPGTTTESRPDDHWRWRLRMAQRIAALLDPARFGVKAAYVFGSTKNGTAGPGERHRPAAPRRGRTSRAATSSRRGSTAGASPSPR